MPRSLYRFIWETSGREQLQLCAFTAVVVALSMAPLELQRRIVDGAVAGHDIHLLAALGGLYLLLLVVQGGIKYVLNVSRGSVVELVTRTIRTTIIDRLALHEHATAKLPDGGTVVSMLAAEAEDVAGFVGESISTPFLQGGSALVVLGYLAWVQPLIAAFAVIVYLPQFIVVPRVQHRINRYARLHAMLVRRLGNRFLHEDGTAHHAHQDIQARRAGFKRLIDRTYTSRIRLYRAKFFLTAFSNFLDALGPLAVLLVGGLLVIGGTTQIGTLVVFISGFQRIADPWDQLITFYRSVAIAHVKYDLIARTLAAHAEPRR
jgi:ABC-type multidrug transport system fused ATPase/permease subunit